MVEWSHGVEYLLRLRQAGWSEMDCGFSEQLLSSICKGCTLQMVEFRAYYRCTDYKYMLPDMYDSLLISCSALWINIINGHERTNCIWQHYNMSKIRHFQYFNKHGFPPAGIWVTVLSGERGMKLCRVACHTLTPGLGWGSTNDLGIPGLWNITILKCYKAHRDRMIQ